MREFHKIMIETQASIDYFLDEVVIQLESCSLKSLKAFADVINAEFGLQPDAVKVLSEEGNIILKIPLNGKQDDQQTETEESEEVKEDLPEPADGWIPLSERGYYKIEGDEIVIGFKKYDDGKIVRFKRVPTQVLREIYEKLPEKSTSDDFLNVARELDFKVSGFQNYYMKILADLFGGKTATKNRSLILVKGDSNE